jgi:hypothetical protein
VTPALLSGLVAAACVLASARRLAFAILPVWLDPQLLVTALEEDRDGALQKLQQIVSADQRAGWERELVASASTSDVSSRPGLVNEQLRELDWRAHRWARVPRVCASIATSAGFLFGSLALIQSLSVEAGDVTLRALVSAVNALAIGIAGTSFCVAVHIRARQAVRKRLAATDRFVERLEGLLM